MADGSPQKYLALFIAEAAEQLEQLSGELVRIEQEPPGGALWDSILRRVHSIKGSAATLGLNEIVDISHAAETLAGKLKTLPMKPPREQVDLLFQAADALLAEVKRAETQLTRGVVENALVGK